MHRPRRGDERPSREAGLKHQANSGPAGILGATRATSTLWQSSETARADRRPRSAIAGLIADTVLIRRKPVRGTSDAVPPTLVSGRGQAHVDAKPTRRTIRHHSGRCLGLGAHNQAPANCALTLAVSMVVLRRQGVPFLGRHFMPAAFATINPRMRRGRARLMNGLERAVVRIYQELSVSIKGHVSPPLIPTNLRRNLPLHGRRDSTPALGLNYQKTIPYRPYSKACIFVTASL